MTLRPRLATGLPFREIQPNYQHWAWQCRTIMGVPNGHRQWPFGLFGSQPITDIKSGNGWPTAALSFGEWSGVARRRRDRPQIHGGQVRRMALVVSGDPLEHLGTVNAVAEIDAPADSVHAKGCDGHNGV